MSRPLGTTVACSECGKKLRGTPTIPRGFNVRRHRRPDGEPCIGHRYTNHKPAWQRRSDS